MKLLDRPIAQQTGRGERFFCERACAGVSYGSVSGSPVS
jgi:hypothetical protein